MSRTGPRTAIRIALLLFAAASALLLGGGSTSAFLPGGQDHLSVFGVVSVASRLGTETIVLTGTVTVQRSDAYEVGGLSVVDLEITELALTGESVTGPVTVTKSAAPASLGEIRSQQPGQDYPADSYIDAYVDVSHPASPGTAQAVHNDLPMRMSPSLSGEPVGLAFWPPIGLAYATALGPCVPLLPSAPKEVCVTSLWFQFDRQPGVGGVSELAALDIRVDSASSMPWALLAFVAGAAAVALGGGWYARRRQPSGGPNP